jgi:CHAT domain-containing protein/Tfp pilus assembly protein PilF
MATCEKAEAWTREGKGPSSQVRLDAAKLKAVLAERKKEWTPDLRDALLAGWYQDGAASQPLYEALLEGMGEQTGDRQASGLGAFLTGQRCERGQRLREAEQAYRRADGHIAATEAIAWRAVTLSKLGMVLRDQGEYAQALEQVRLAQQMYQRLYPKERYPDGHPLLATGLNNLGIVLIDQGEYAQALEQYRLALQMNQALYPRERYPRGHPLLALSHNNLGLGLHRLGDYGQALEEYQLALEMTQRLYPKERYPRGHPDQAHAMNNLGMVLQGRGEYDKALEQVRHALEMRQALYPRDRYPQGHAALASSLHCLGYVLQVQGDYGKALEQYRLTLEMRQRLYPKDRYPRGHPELANCLANLGAVLRDLGESAPALEYARLALEMDQALYPKERYPQGHPYLASSLRNLGMVFRSQGDYDKAREHLRLALEMNRRLYPKERYPRGHPELGTALADLGRVLWNQGEYAQAREHLQRALEVYQTLFPKDRYPQGSPQQVHTLNNLGSVLRELGEYAQAREHIQRALEMRQALYPRERYPRGHPDLTRNLYTLGLVLLAQGEHGKAREQFRLALQMYQQLATNLAADAPEARALNFVASLPLARDAYLSVGCYQPADAAADYALIWQSKAALSRVFERRQLALRAASSPRVRERWQNLVALRRQRERLLLARLPPDSKWRDARLVELEKLIEQAERELAPLLPALPRAEQLARSTPEELRKALPARTVLIDLLRYVRMEQDKDTPGSKGRKWTPGYVAFVIATKGVQRVELGEARAIEETLESWRRAIVEAAPGGDSSERYARQLRRLVWDKLVASLPADTSTVYLSPDGPLCRLPWAALPGREPGSVLLEDHALAMVPHGPFLLDRLTLPVPKEEGKATLLTLGGVRYDQPAPALEAPDALLAGAGLSRSGVVRADKGLWASLPGTARELERIQALVGKRLSVRSLTGNEAGPDQVRQALPEARIAHLAIHGFFADPSFRSVLQLDEKLFARRDDLELGLTLERRGAGARSPLVLSGLVLAGANRPDTPDRGILSADSLVNLRLDRLELAVLSACESGLGETAGGEGVFGLQRAFHLAGAHNVVASLWKVDDEATAALMTLFYRNLFEEKLPPLEALRRAQLALLYNPGQVKEWSLGRGPDLKKVYPGSGSKVPAEKPEPSGRLPVRGWAGFTLSGLGR